MRRNSALAQMRSVNRRQERVADAFATLCPQRGSERAKNIIIPMNCALYIHLYERVGKRGEICCITSVFSQVWSLKLFIHILGLILL